MPYGITVKGRGAGAYPESFSSRIRAMKLLKEGGGGAYTPTPKTTEYGLSEYQQALSDWRKDYSNYASMMKTVTPALQQMMGYYAPGGGYGAGLRTEAEETIRGGVSQDLANMVASGMSSQFGTRGVQTRAGSELSKLYKNIEDTRNQLWQQAIQPYAQMMAAMAQMQQTRPTYASYVRPITTMR